MCVVQWPNIAFDLVNKIMALSIRTDRTSSTDNFCSVVADQDLLNIHHDMDPNRLTLC